LLYIWGQIFKTDILFLDIPKFTILEQASLLLLHPILEQASFLLLHPTLEQASLLLLYPILCLPLAVHPLTFLLSTGAMSNVAGSCAAPERPATGCASVP
jgi:hypothetical protein